MIKKRLIGETIDNYQILEEMGRGGMGVVFKARDNRLNKEFALKMMSADLIENASLLHRFETEAQALAKLDHPNIVTIYRLAECEWGPFFVMQLVKGRTLADVTKEIGPLPLPRFFKIFKQSLSALAYAHREGIIHRDIKPGNIMLTASDDVKITDFGLAKMRLATNVTKTMTVAGTLTYMSPEQIQGLAMVDQRGDLYSLGMTMYESLVGTTPFAEIQSDYRISKMIVEGTIPSVVKMRPGLPRDVVDIVMKSLRPDRDKRFQSADEMLEALSASESRMATSPTQSPKRNFKVPIAISLSSIAMVLVGIYFWQQRKESGTTSDFGTSLSQQTILTTNDTRRKDSLEAARKQVASTATQNDLGEAVKPKIPVPLKSILAIRSNPSGATVFLDDARIGRTPLANSVDLVGKHQVQIILAGYEPYTNTVDFRPGKEADMRVTLKRIPPVVENPSIKPNLPTTGSLRLTIMPFGNVYLNSKQQLSNTDFAVLKLEPGTYSVRIENPSFGTWQRSMKVENEQQLETTVNFNTFITRGVRCVDETGVPVRNAEIFVDGTSVGKYTPAEISVRTGLHTLEVRKAGYEFPEGTMRVNFDSITPAAVEFRMKKSQ